MRVGLWIACALPGLAACGGGGGAPPVPTSIRLTTFQAADLVVGQPIFTLNTPNQGQGTPSAQTLARPGMPSAGPIFLPDTSNHRVLGYDRVPFVNNVGANFVLGQPGLGFAIPGVGATALREPVCARVAGGRLFVSDGGNHRVLVWSALPTTSAAPASLAVGQTDMDSAAAATSATRLRDPAGIEVVGSRLIVADRSNNRVLVWNTLPAVSGTPADLVLGQADFIQGLANRGVQPAADTLNEPYAVWSDGVRLAVADRGNHRVLLWTTFPTQNGQPADVVLGQVGFAETQAAAGAGGMTHPSSVTSNGAQFVVADAGNHRVLVWDSFPELTATPADAVLGQADFEGFLPNDENQDGIPEVGSSARTFFGADQVLTVTVVGTDLFVGDTGNHRLLVFHGD